MNCEKLCLLMRVVALTDIESTPLGATMELSTNHGPQQGAALMKRTPKYVGLDGHQATTMAGGREGAAGRARRRGRPAAAGRLARGPPRQPAARLAQGVRPDLSEPRRGFD